MINEVLFWIFIIIAIVAVPVLGQIHMEQSINEKGLKLVRIKRFGFLFRGIRGESPSSHGVVVPMLYIQIQGYALGILIFIFGIISSFKLNQTTVFILVGILIIHMMVFILTAVIAGYVSKRRCGKIIYQDGIVIYTGTKNYLVVVKEKGVITHYCVDKNVTQAYVIKSQSVEKDIFDFSYGKKYKRYLTVDLSRYKCVPCPDWLKKAILANQRELS